MVGVGATGVIVVTAICTCGHERTAVIIKTPCAIVDKEEWCAGSSNTPGRQRLGQAEFLT